MEDNEFFLDPDEKGHAVTFSKEKLCGRRSNLPTLHTSAFQFPLSFSTPSALGELSTSTLSTTAAPSSISCIIKSSSAFSDKESKESKFMHSLAESHSMEISVIASEFCLSNSDSNLQLCKQLGQQPNVQYEPLPMTMPSSPTESRPNLISSSSLLIAELEDTRRKLSEVMQEPLSKLSKIIGEDSCSPKLQKGDSSVSPGSATGSKSVQSEDEAGEWHKKNESPLRVCETPLRRPRRDLTPRFTPEICRKLGNESSRYEICTYGDVMQVLELHSGRTEVKRPEQKDINAPPAKFTPSSDLLKRWLVCVGLLAYSFFVLPLSSYATGLSLGLACGFMLGLTVVMMLAPQQLPAASEMPISSPTESLLMESIGTALKETAKRKLQGWMNQIYSYDPETYHPSLCHSVFATLDGCHLCLAYPRANIRRQATFNEPKHDTTFVRSLCFQLSNCKVSLLPKLIAKKRLWNKKYPICIILAEEEQFVEEEKISKAANANDKGAKQKNKVADQTTTLYLFGRTGREKEEWYQHFLLASKTKICREESKPEVCSAEGSSQGSNDDLPSMLDLKEMAGSVREKILLDYNSYMACFITSASCSLTPSSCHSEPVSPTNTKRFSSDPVAGCGDPVWLNAMIGRIFWDFLQERYWADKVAHKIQKKLSKIRLPYFMKELTLTQLDLGTCIPQVLSTSSPSVDHRGLWLELEVLYTGCLHMTLETKMNLCKLGKEESCSETYSITEPSRISGKKPRVCIIADSDEESTSAGSSDEEQLMSSEPQGSLGDTSIHSGTEGHSGRSTSRKILHFVDKIAKSKYFQRATENEYIKKKIADVSNTPLLLSVEVLELSGTLAVNIPPPPTDRIWYSFRVPPRLDLRVKPMLGEREVTFTHITEWIERKLQCEFQKIFVMPNMDDLYLPLMSSGLDNTEFVSEFLREKARNSRRMGAQTKTQT